MLIPIPAVSPIERQAVAGSRQEFRHRSRVMGTRSTARSYRVRRPAK